MTKYRLIIEGSIEWEGPDWVPANVFTELSSVFLGKRLPDVESIGVKFEGCTMIIVEDDE